MKQRFNLWCHLDQRYKVVKYRVNVLCKKLSLSFTSSFPAQAGLMFSVSLLHRSNSCVYYILTPFSPTSLKSQFFHVFGPFTCYFNNTYFLFYIILCPPVYKSTPLLNFMATIFHFRRWSFSVMRHSRLPLTGWHLFPAGNRFSKPAWPAGNVWYQLLQARSTALLQVC